MSQVSLPSAYPVVGYADAEAGLRFLHTLGFEDVWIVRDDDGRIQHAELRWNHGAGAIMLGQSDTDASARTGSARTYLVATADVDLSGLCATALEQGGTVARPLGDGPAGGQVFSVFDPEGNEWEVGHYPGGGA
jgi:uncharacterized glyoxalase superfamily protein PhnB